MVAPEGAPAEERVTDLLAALKASVEAARQRKGDASRKRAPTASKPARRAAGAAGKKPKRGRKAA